MSVVLTSGPLCGTTHKHISMPPCFCSEDVLLFSAYLFCTIEVVHRQRRANFGKFSMVTVFRSLPADGFPFLAKNANKARELPYLAHGCKNDELHPPSIWLTKPWDFQVVGPNFQRWWRNGERAPVLARRWWDGYRPSDRARRRRLRAIVAIVRSAHHLPELVARRDATTQHSYGSGARALIKRGGFSGPAYAAAQHTPDEHIDPALHPRPRPCYTGAAFAHTNRSVMSSPLVRTRSFGGFNFPVPAPAENLIDADTERKMQGLFSSYRSHVSNSPSRGIAGGSGAATVNPVARWGGLGRRASCLRRDRDEEEGGGRRTVENGGVAKVKAPAKGGKKTKKAKALTDIANLFRDLPPPPAPTTTATASTTAVTAAAMPPAAPAPRRPKLKPPPLLLHPTPSIRNPDGNYDLVIVPSRRPERARKAPTPADADYVGKPKVAGRVKKLTHGEQMAAKNAPSEEALLTRGGKKRAAETQAGPARKQPYGSIGRTPSLTEEHFKLMLMENLVRFEFWRHQKKVFDFYSIDKRGAGRQRTARNGRSGGGDAVEDREAGVHMVGQEGRRGGTRKGAGGSTRADMGVNGCREGQPSEARRRGCGCGTRPILVPKRLLYSGWLRKAGQKVKRNAHGDGVRFVVPRASEEEKHPEILGADTMDLVVPWIELEGLEPRALVASWRGQFFADAGCKRGGVVRRYGYGEVAQTNKHRRASLDARTNRRKQARQAGRSGGRVEILKRDMWQDLPYSSTPSNKMRPLVISGHLQSGSSHSALSVDLKPLASWLQRRSMDFALVIGRTAERSSIMFKSSQDKITCSAVRKKSGAAWKRGMIEAQRTFASPKATMRYFASKASECQKDLNFIVVTREKVLEPKDKGCPTSKTTVFMFVSGDFQELQMDTSVATGIPNCTTLRIKATA
ncbi:hypothetical protein C8R43DRAFT_1106849 [Mycena crocata]|nr:hypothetical protein C8R43DRAFT_1106849 [Mycena crocata]